jgi:hypothetical protein
MTTPEKHNAFTPAHHGLLLAWIARQVCQRSGPVKGEMAIRKAIRRYGEQRGHRMALRAQADGKELNTISYMVYGEWSASPDELVSRLEQNNHHNIRMLVERCPWNASWAEQGLLEFGRMYCQEIDQALMRGFNPNLHLDVLKTQTNDRQPCDFIFHGSPLSMQNVVALKLGKKVNPGKRVVLPWEYHCGHMYKTMTDVLTNELGACGKEAAEAGLAEFSAHFGAEAAEIVQNYLQTDFTQLPEGVMIKLEANHGYSQSS